MIHYLLQTFVFQLVFLLVYQLFLQKETCLNYNRIYLLLTPVLSLVLPFLQIPILKNSIAKNYHIMLQEVQINSLFIEDTISFELGMALYLVWLLGILLSCWLFILKGRKLYRLKKTGTLKKQNHVSVIILPKTTTAFSFLKTIYLGEQLSDKNKETIFLHESIHINELHSIDLLFFEMVRIVFWFNPLIYIFQKKISLLHEYIADAKVSRKQPKKQYYQKLLSEVFKTTEISFINTFINRSYIHLTIFGKKFSFGNQIGQIKKRIIMLQKINSANQTKSLNSFKYLLILPLILGMLVYSSCIQEASKTDQEQVKTVTEINKTEVGQTTDYPFAVIDRVPVFPGCSGTKEELKKCMAQKISKFVNSNFNIKLADNLGLTGRQRITVMFKIDKYGTIVDVRARAAHPDLVAEAERVVSLLPKMKPGEQDGKPVGVLYTLPIIFEVYE